ncbi:MAG: signal peptidase II [Eubacteriales bacterium]|nr:signal peptidase II [Eubacteriales bacterium]
MNNSAFKIQSRKNALLVTVVLLLDFITKAWFFDANFILIPNVLKLYGTKNYGAAFSFLATYPQYVTLLSVCLIAIIVYMCSQAMGVMLNIALSLVLGGALGNFLDRLTRGYVVDFIQTLFINFPVFNIADICITIGAALSCIAVLFFEKND